MNAEAILAAVATSGAAIAVDGENIRITSSELVPAPLMDAIRRHKPELLALLRQCPPEGSDQEGAALIAARVAAAQALWGAYAKAEEPAVARCWRAWLAANERYCSWSAGMADRALARTWDRRAAEALRRAEGEAKHQGLRS